MIECWWSSESKGLACRCSPPAPATLNLIVRSSTFWRQAIATTATAIMSQFRAAKLDIGCFAKIRNIRDHTKRKVYMENEPERYATNFFTQGSPQLMRM
jgi:hypothetical protein